MHIISIIQSIIIPTAHAAEEAAANPDVATMFGLNFKLFIAQLFNFAIVLLVLWKWVFTPVTKALQARTQKIEQSLAHAEQVTKDKKEFEVWKEKAMAEARKEAGGIVAGAKADAEALREELLGKTKTAQDALVAEGVERLKREQADMLSEARGQLADLVVEASEKVLREKMTDAKDKELAKKALGKV